MKPIVDEQSGFVVDRFARNVRDVDVMRTALAGNSLFHPIVIVDLRRDL